MTTAHDFGTAAVALFGALLALIVALRPVLLAATAALRAYEADRAPGSAHADPPLPIAAPTDWQVATWETLTGVLKQAGAIGGALLDGKGIPEKTTALASVDLGAVVGSIDAATDFVRAVHDLHGDHDDATFLLEVQHAMRLAEALLHSVRWGASPAVTVDEPASVPPVLTGAALKPTVGG